MKKLSMVLSTVLISLMWSSCGGKQELTESVVCTQNSGNYSKVEYEYNKYADTTLFLTSFWSNEEAEWQYSEKKVCEYDEYGRRILETTYRFDQEAKDWKQVQKKQFEYDGSLLTRTSSDGDEPCTETYQYDSGRLTKRIVEGSGGEYNVGKYIEVYKYSNNTLSKKTTYENKVSNRNILNIIKYDSYGRKHESTSYCDGYKTDYSRYEYNYDGTLRERYDECYEGENGSQTTTFAYNERKELIEVFSKHIVEICNWQYDLREYQYKYFKKRIKSRNNQMLVSEEVSHKEADNTYSYSDDQEETAKVYETNTSTQKSSQKSSRREFKGFRSPQSVYTYLSHVTFTNNNGFEFQLRPSGLYSNHQYLTGAIQIVDYDEVSALIKCSGPYGDMTLYLVAETLLKDMSDGTIFYIKE